MGTVIFLFVIAGLLFWLIDREVSCQERPEKSIWPRGHNWRMVSFDTWGHPSWNNYEANWTCEYCEVDRHEFGISSQQASRMFDDWKKIKNALAGKYFGLWEHDLDELLNRTPLDKDEE